MQKPNARDDLSEIEISLCMYLKLLVSYLDVVRASRKLWRRGCDFLLVP